MKIYQPLLMASSLMWPAMSWGDEWTNIATAVTVTEGRLCAGELAADGTGTDIKCDDSNPYIDDDGNMGIGTATPGNSLTVVGDISATTINATQLCDENGANCTTLSGGLSGVSSLVSLTDTNISTPSDGASLQWDNSSSRWIAGTVLEGGCTASNNDLMPSMAAATTGGYTVSHSSQYNSSFPGWKAFDNNATSGYGWTTTNGTTTGILTVQLLAPAQIVKYTISANPTVGATVTPQDWTIEGSSDGSSWTVLSTVTGETGWSNLEKRTYTFSNTATYEYYRINITAINGGPYAAIEEMELFQQTCSGADDLGNHEASQNLNMSTFDIIGTGDVSVSTLNATQLCDEDGANCTDLSDGISSASALASLTDVSATGAATGSILRYDGTSWTSVTDLSAALSTTTMVPNWPDAILCSGSAGQLLFDLNNIYIASSYAEYRMRGSWGDYALMRYNISTGAQTTHTTTGGFSGYMTDCSGKSITTLYADGQAFNFLGNNGAQISLTEIADVSASAPTEGQLLSYDASEGEWVAKDVISETIILNSADDNPCVVSGGVRQLSFNPTTGRLAVCRP